MNELDLNNNLSFAQSAFREKDFKLVDRCCSAVLELYPLNPQANYLIGLVAIEFGLFEKATTFLKTATQEDSSIEAYWDSLVRSYLELNDLENASKTLEKANRQGFILHELAMLVNDNSTKEKREVKAQSQENIANAIKLYQVGRLSLALNKAEKLLKIYPSNIQLLTVCGASHAGLFEYEKAVRYFKKCLKIDPNSPDSNNNLGLAYWNTGRDKEAEIHFKEAIKLRENFSEAHRNLSEIIDYRNEPTLLEKLEVCLSVSDVSSDDRAQLLFARAKAKRDLEEYASSFASYKEGNEIRKKLSKYDFESDRQLFHKIKSVAEKLTEILITKDMDPTAPVPIFILGMPRSGTSLIEQILSSHTLVRGGGEVPFLRNLGGSLAVGVRAISPEELERLNKEYLLKISSISNGRPYVTDKLPHNFLFIPLIMAALPRARIIHVKRDPVATCWSSFTQYFTTDGLAYSNDLNDLENYYLAYNDLLNHWDKLYSGKIYHCNYDSLVNNPNSEIRNLLSFVNLEWEEQCLTPDANERQVNTASHSQVRSRIYKGSSKNWKKYEEFLRYDFKKLKKLSI